ncbi:MAG: DUF6880 family protein [Neisseriaceae bacterium]
MVENKDDSSGCAMEFLYTCVDLWGKAWQNVEDKDIKQLAKLVNDYYRNHQYIGSQIFESFKVALGKEGLVYLEEYLASDVKSLLYIVEQQNDPDKYCKILEQSNLISDVKYVLKLSAMLVDKFRATEAIECLEKVPENSIKMNDYIEHRKLLIKAYEDDGRVEDAQNTRWQLFIKTLYPDFYTKFMKHVKSEEDRDKYKQQAIDYALNAKDFNHTLVFMEAIQEYDELENLIINNLEQLSEYNYSYYRKLSKGLASHGKYLPATLLRRYLADNVLLQAKSKYYDYAISDLKQAIEFGDKIDNWKSFLDTKHYFSHLIEKHKKKYSFLEKLHPLLGLIK